MATDNIPLPGCRPTPLASYLKALGVLRLVSEQSDPTAAGFWRDEGFQLRTRLGRDGLRHFFLHEYAPTPIIAPWNGGSGFYPKDAKEGIEALAAAEASRFASYTTAIALGERLIEERGLNERPSDKAKLELIAGLRACAEDSMLAWIDAAVALTPDRIAFPPLLGTGGNDGRLDFTNNFMQRVTELFDVNSGSAIPKAVRLLDAALFNVASLGLAAAAVGQFSPGAAGGPNSTAGYEGPSRVNSWDFVLMLEGAVVFAGGISRRLEGADAAYLSYPFTVRAAAAGFGTASPQEQTESRGEIWLPLWQRPSTLGEVRMLFREGRLSVGARPARDGLDAARAVAGLGADRRIVAFERYGFVKRQGLAYLAAPLGRRIVRPNPTAELASDLDWGRWLERFRREAAADAPVALRAAALDLEEALFELTAMRTAAPEEPARVQDVLTAVGKAASVLAARPRLWGRLRPPPLLRAEWLRRAYDDTPEFRIAAALAWLHAQALEQWSRGNEPLATGQASASDSDGKWLTILPIRVHFAPLDRERALDWNESEGGGLAVWGSGALIGNLCEVAQRRLVEQTRIGLPEKPFSAIIGVGSSDIAAFLEGGAGFDRRVADLLSGLCWVGWPDKEAREKLFAVWKSEPGLLPLPYAALKPLFTPDVTLRQHQLRLPENLSLPIPPALPNLLAADRISDALRLGMSRARSSGLATPFVGAQTPSRRNDGRRLLAALTIPVRLGVVSDCISRAYPSEEEEPEYAD
jgi:CRISPR-associated protein Csx17